MNAPPPEQYDVAPERLERWIERWAQRHGGVARTVAEPAAVTLTGADGATARFEPPFPPLGDTGAGVDALLAHATRPRTVGVLLVRLGGHAAGIFEGRTLRASRVGSRLVHGRHRAGGSSANRFRRRRENQARQALEAAADTAARILAEPARTGALDAVILGGDRRALSEVLEDPRLAPLAALAAERVIDVPEPRRAVLEAAPDRFLATRVIVQEP